jgi:hypothetical protein
VSTATLTVRGPQRAVVINPRCRSCSFRRYYDPQTGQFVSVDPAVDQTEAPYAYASGDPVNNLDPLGLCNKNPFGSSFWTQGNCLSDAAEKAAGAGKQFVSGITNDPADFAAGTFAFLGGTFVGVAGYVATAACIEETAGLETTECLKIAALAGLGVGGLYALSGYEYARVYRAGRRECRHGAK